MKTRWRWLAVLALVSGCAGDEDHSPPGAGKYTKVRKPAVAGMFYPKDTQALAKAVEEYLHDAPDHEFSRLRALICPHAGYRYSGAIAALAYKQLQGREITTAVVLAPSHTARFDGASIPDFQAYQTPLGLVELSPKARQWAKVRPFVCGPKAEVRRPGWWSNAPKRLPNFGQETPHTWEHSLEVQLPFLQAVLKGFQLVPAVCGQVDAKALADALADRLDDKTILIASSDLSHFHPYKTAIQRDVQCIRAIQDLDIDAMADAEACGKTPILVVMHLAKRKGWKVRLLDYRNSGDTAGRKESVVGYAAVAFYEGQAPGGEKE